MFEDYNIDYLKQIKSFLETALQHENIYLVTGEGKHKTPQQRDYEKICAYLTKYMEYEHHLNIIGVERNSYAKTDPSATFMHMKEDHMRNSQLEPGYNVQIGVANKYILYMDIFNERNDYKTFIPFLEGFKKVYGYYPHF